MSTHQIVLPDVKRNEVLDSPCTHFLVGQVLDLAADKDPVDAYHDILLAAAILRGELGFSA